MTDDGAVEPVPRAADSLRELPAVTALSRHTSARDLRFTVAGKQLNAWCVVPGNPFAMALLLLPNRPDEAAPEVSFGPIEGPGLSAITMLLVSPPEPEHANLLAVDACVMTAAGEVAARERVVLGAGERAPLTLHLPPDTGPVRLSVAVSFERFGGTRTFGSVRMRYLAAYADSELMRLFNEVGTDKGSEVYWGEGVPHLYALAYEPLLAARREQALNLLEIGLDTASQASGSPADAPSLRAWRRFLPHATLYGFDLNDFSFLAQRDTHLIRGDQSSPADLRRLVAQLSGAALDVVIDDGSHVPSHQQVSLTHLFDSVAPGGVYVIEDLSWQPGDESPTTAEVLRRFIDTGRIESPFIAPDDARRLERSIGEVIVRKPNDSELAILSRRQT